MKLRPFCLFLLLSGFSGIAGEPPPLEVDVCVFGGTSGGAAAAVQVARLGRTVLLTEPGGHLGGMTSGGLSAVDIGEPRSVGGIAREYFTKLAATAGVTLAWDKPFVSTGGPATGGAYAIEPHQAERVFQELVREAGVQVRFGARLAGVVKSGARITELAMEDGTRVRAGMFLDCTYEGDLMAKAGVSYTLMRESNARYGESFNGIQYAEKFLPRRGHLPPGPNGRVPGGQGVWDRDFPLDPYVIKGKPESGLLPLIQEGEPGAPGEEAPGVQAYCFRLCLTTDPANRMPIAPPPDYDPKRYEIVARFIEACLANGDDMDLRWFSKHDPLPRNKWDFNTATFGGNLPGASHAWPEASYAGREQIAREHENYHRGLLHFLATDERVPEKVRRDMQRFGLPRDEFVDRGGWPHQIYVREARRMVSDLVMTEHHTFGREIAPCSVGLGSYGTDVHEIRRIVKDGVVIREGKLAGGRGGFGPYQVGYGAIVPKRAECENLLVPFALSASHSAFASIRMEPVFMITSQSAATAAVLALREKVAIQDLDYAKLQARLLQDGQVLEWREKSPPAEPETPGGGDGQTHGILLDDGAGEYRGAWVSSARQPSLAGPSYRHDGNQEQGSKSARFTPEIAEAGEYEVRLLYVATDNRASNVRVTVRHEQGEARLRVDQRQPALELGVPKALGRYRFAAGRQGFVEVSNEGADGYVVVDGAQWVPVGVADRERSGEVGAGFRREGKGELSDGAAAAASAVAVSPLTREVPGRETAPPAPEPVRLAQAARPEEVEGKRFDLMVAGGTASGVACAVRAAREGCTVLLVQHNGHLGGMLTNGLMQWDALYGGPRAPLFTELLGRIEQDAVARFGRDSKAHQVLRYTHEHYPVSWVEPHVMERECNRLVAAERNITLLLEHVPVTVEREGARLKSVTLRAYGGSGEIRVGAETFADATYEGDLMALAGVAYRVGREARDEYGEPHAGQVFVNIDSRSPESVAAEGLNIRAYGSRQGSVDPASPFTADGASQAYNYRFCVSKDPENRVLLSEPPPDYRREEYLHFERKGIATNAGPNLKSHMNSPILPGENHAYPEASWAERETIMKRHRNFALGLIWFLQNDESVPEKKREQFRQWGLARDEFAGNGHIPYEMYVREARRLVGRYVVNERDGMLAGEYRRAPVQPDSVAVTDWYMDSHACTTASRPDYHYDGKLILTEESRPMQIPYRALLPREVNNLLVPVCLSSTHVAWGAIRLEPVWMQTGEAAGWAAALAKQRRTTPGELDPECLLRVLVSRRHLVSFFNELKVDVADARIPAAQYFGTKGFFADYRARLDEPLTEAVAKVWAEEFDDPRLRAAAVARAEASASPPTGRSRGEELLRRFEALPEP